MKKIYANGLLVLVTIIWGGGFIATSQALDSLDPFAIMMIRFLGASIFPLVICILYRKPIWRREHLGGLIAGTFLFLAFALQTIGLQYSTPSKNAFLTATNVVFVPYLLWYVFRRKPSRKECIASLICLFGIALLTLKPDQLLFSFGDSLSLGCAVFFAIHMIALERYARHMDVFVLTFLQMISAGMISMVACLLWQSWPSHIPSSAWYSMAFLIFGSTLLCYLLQTWAQKYTSANTASMILSMEALWASIFSYLFFHEVMSIGMLIGAGCIFFAILYVEYKPKG